MDCNELIMLFPNYDAYIGSPNLTTTMVVTAILGRGQPGNWWKWGPLSFTKLGAKIHPQNAAFCMILPLKMHDFTRPSRNCATKTRLPQRFLEVSGEPEATEGQQYVINCAVKLGPDEEYPPELLSTSGKAVAF